MEPETTDPLEQYEWEIDSAMKLLSAFTNSDVVTLDEVLKPFVNKYREYGRAVELLAAAAGLDGPENAGRVWGLFYEILREEHAALENEMQRRLTKPEAGGAS